MATSVSYFKWLLVENCVCVVDSERADPHHKYNKGILKEASNINKSLVTLGNVIVALGNGRHRRAR